MKRRALLLATGAASLGSALVVRPTFGQPALNAMTRQLVAFVDRILKGANPADLPVEQPTGSIW